MSQNTNTAVYNRFLVETHNDETVHSNNTTNNATIAKATAMCVLFAASMTLGLLPIKLSQWFKWHTTPKNNVYVELLLAFGGGVLMCTTFLHLLPEVAENLEDNASQIPETSLPIAESLMCIGFFLMYFVEECVHLYLHRKESKTRHTDVDISTSAVGNNVDCEKSNSDHADHSHLVVIDSKAVTTVRGLLIVLALSVHELFEGLSVGLEHSASNVWYMFGAVSAHKLVIAFCIGIELVTLRLKTSLIVVYVFTFAVVSPLGIGIGIAVTEKSQSTVTLPSVFLQGLASGTLLYVVFFEILTSDRRTGLKQFFAIVIGFGMMTGLTMLDAD